ncbi:MAG: hypothetical protein HYT87_14785 [Nitrospirae bacterium]|nr:hypothetical protein [Nitrospirota bacterium]
MRSTRKWPVRMGTAALLGLILGGCATTKGAGRKADDTTLSCRQVGETLRCSGLEGGYVEFAPEPLAVDLSGMKKKREAYDAGYQAGMESMHKIRQGYEEGVRYVFKRPVWQKVKLPAEVKDGVFHPEREVYVLVEPGRYELKGGAVSPPLRSTDDEMKNQRVLAPDAPSPASGAEGHE